MFNEISGMLLFDKPEGITSFKAVHKIKKLLNVKKTGHCGTLDPFASGLLVVLIGKATKLQDNFMKQDKVYLSTFLLGVQTDTYDICGKVLSQGDASKIKKSDIKNELKSFLGDILQVPPMYSALKINGQKLYELARQGIEVERKPRKIHIKKIKIIKFKNNELTLKIYCSSGTYIRSIANDLGKQLGCGAIVKSLRRESVGKFKVKKAVCQNDLEDTNKIISKIIPCKKLEKFIKQ